MGRKRAGKRKRPAEDEPDSQDWNQPSPISPSYQTFPLTEKCHHYTKIGEVPYDIHKYWHQRYDIWEAYDDGIQMTDDAWFGVTPEPVARQVAYDMSISVSAEKTTIIDIFAGAGGNAIAFALSGRWTNVIAIEKDASTIACAQHNAALHGVAEYITWINADCFAYLSENSSTIDPSTTTVFASPPWGGVVYSEDEIFNLSTMFPYSVEDVHKACANMESALFLPRNSDLRQIAKLAPKGKKIEAVQYCMKGASKGLMVYIPAAIP